MSNKSKKYLWGGILGVILLALLLLIETPIQNTHPDFTTTLSFTQTNTIIRLPTVTLTTQPAPTLTFTPKPTATSSSEPDWVADFSGPILAAIKDREPDFQDDFSIDTKRWYPVSLGDFDYEKTLLIEGGVMQLNEGYGISNYYFQNKPDIVMQFDVLQPVDGISINPSFFFRHFTRTDSFVLTLHPGGNWEVQLHNETYDTGKFNLHGQTTQVIMIVDHTQIAYYINGIPVAYYDEPRLLDIRNDDKRYFDCSECVVDNVKVWNLDKIPDLP